MRLLRLLLLLLLLLLLSAACAGAGGGGERFTEHVQTRRIRHGGGGGGEMQHSRFTFVMSKNSSSSGSGSGSGSSNHYVLLPKQVGVLMRRYAVRRFALTLTRGSTGIRGDGVLTVPVGAALHAQFFNNNRRRSTSKRRNWLCFANALGSVYGVATSAVTLAHTARPHWWRNGGGSSYYAALPRETVCTENVVPWLQLLPCRAELGLAASLHALPLFDAHYLSVAVHGSASAPASATRRIVLTQTLDVVLPPSPPSATSTQEALRCPVATTTTTTTTTEDVFEKRNVTLQRFVTGATQRGGTLHIRIENRSGTRAARVVYFDSVPWFLRLWFHSLRATLNGDDVDVSLLSSMRFMAASKAKQRPSELELALELPPRATLRLAVDFEKRLLTMDEYPPDVSRGFDVQAAVLCSSSSSSSTTTTSDKDCVYSRNLLVLLPYPDFSMPFIVIAFACTVLAFFVGSMANILSASAHAIRTTPASPLARLKTRLLRHCRCCCCCCKK
jgi:phosphatidylinositol glycan class T